MTYTRTQKDWNNYGILSKWAAYKDGELVEVVMLTVEKKRWYETRGWTFERTRLPYVARRVQ